ncbi:MAG: hypothetical protein OXF20_13025 [Gammaproteobacteria bacterium]|nr:hypothetical protein [Gammaproteobacteria bacterium]
MSNIEADTTKKLLTLAGCFAVIGTLALFSPQKASAQIGHGVADGVGDPGPGYTPPRSGEPPSVERRAYLCFEEWQKSYAYTEQYCIAESVRWDSYRITPGYYAFDEATHMKYSYCRIKAKCIKGAQAIGIAKYNSKIDYRNVDKLRRCENPGTELNTDCDPLTQEELEVAVDEYFDALNQPQGNSNQPSYRSQGSNTGLRN